MVAGLLWFGYEHWQRERFTSYWLTRLAPTGTVLPVEAHPSATFTPVPTATPTPAEDEHSPGVASPAPVPSITAQAPGETLSPNGKEEPLASTFTPGAERLPTDINPTDVPAAAVMPTPTPTPTRCPPPVRIVIPAIGVDAPVVEVQWEAVVDSDGQVHLQWQTADYAAGHHFNSANPGEGSNVVLSGHNNIKGKVFENLWKLEPGDKVWLYNAEGKAFVYEVKRVLIVPEKNAPEARRKANARFMDPTPDETLTLISCWPPWSNTHRVIVVARPRRLGTFREGEKPDPGY